MDDTNKATASEHELRLVAHSRYPGKRSDWVAHEIKCWIDRHGLAPGDRLPPEKELIRLFSVAKGTMREALKSLEVQGLIRLSTGPRGGATIAEVTMERAATLLGNYFYFQPINVAQIYELRHWVEPEVAARAAPVISEADIERLANMVEFCACGGDSRQDQHEVRMAELDFHDILADACPNPLLRFNSRFLNSLLKNNTVYRQVYGVQSAAAAAHPGPPEMAATMQQMGDTALVAHRRIVDALRARDSAQARDHMARHMREAEDFLIKLEAYIKNGFI